MKIASASTKRFIVTLPGFFFFDQHRNDGELPEDISIPLTNANGKTGTNEASYSRIVFGMTLIFVGRVFRVCMATGIAARQRLKAGLRMQNLCHG